MSDRSPDRSDGRPGDRTQDWRPRCCRRNRTKPSLGWGRGLRWGTCCAVTGTRSRSPRTWTSGRSRRCGCWVRTSRCGRRRRAATGSCRKNARTGTRRSSTTAWWKKQGCAAATTAGVSTSTVHASNSPPSRRSRRSRTTFGLSPAGRKRWAGWFGCTSAPTPHPNSPGSMCSSIPGSRTPGTRCCPATGYR